MTDSNNEEKLKILEKLRRLSFEVMDMLQKLEVANLGKFNKEHPAFKDKFGEYIKKHSGSEKMRIFEDYGLLILAMEQNPDDFTLEQIRELEELLQVTIDEGNEIHEAIEGGQGNLERAARNSFGSNAKRYN